MHLTKHLMVISASLSTVFALPMVGLEDRWLAVREAGSGSDKLVERDIVELIRRSNSALLQSLTGGDPAGGGANGGLTKITRSRHAIGTQLAPEFEESKGINKYGATKTGELPHAKKEV